VDVDTAPDGNLVYTSLGDFSATGGSIHEISYSALNHSPVAHPTSDAAGEPTVNFDGSTSSDVEDGQALAAYDWDFGDDTVHGTDATESHTYAEAGRYRAKLTVTDSGGKSGTDSVIVQVGTPPANVQIQAPANYRDSEAVTLHASADSAEPLTYSWQLLLRHLSHYHPFTHQTGPDITFTPPDDHDADAFVGITLTATDSDGLVATQTMQLQPQKVPFNLLSEPVGAPMDYAGRSVTGPLHTQSAIGFKASASAARSFTAAGHDYVFDGWDSGDSRIQTFTIPDGGLTLTARYRDVTPTIIKPAPPPVLPPPDHSGPRLRFRKLDARKGVLSGTVSDAAGVRSVYVALGHAMEGKRCHWWATSVGRLSRATRSCSKPLWIHATLKGSGWTAKLNRKRIPAGYYRVLLRSVDRLGNTSSKLQRQRVKKVR
jgi:PKD repeat protein